MANGCSFFPDVIFGHNIKPACDSHDANYWFQQIDRKESDVGLRKDVNEILPSYLRFIGWIMYLGVRIAGWIAWNKYKGGNHGKRNSKKMVSIKN